MKACLQKLTESKNKLGKILALPQITWHDLMELTEKEKGELLKQVNEKANELKGEERDKFYKQIEPIISEETKNDLWASNHNQITWAISSFMGENHRMPSKSEIAKKAGLSRQTVHKHLKSFASHPMYLEQIEQFRFMTVKILARLYQLAFNGDTRAAKLYLDAVGDARGLTPVIQNQNNYIQINGLILSQETVKKLSTEQLGTIERILKSTLPIV